MWCKSFVWCKRLVDAVQEKGTKAYKFVNGVEDTSVTEIYNSVISTLKVVGSLGSVTIGNSTVLENVFRLNVGGKYILSYVDRAETFLVSKKSKKKTLSLFSKNWKFKFKAPNVKSEENGWGQNKRLQMWIQSLIKGKELVPKEDPRATLVDICHFSIGGCKVKCILALMLFATTKAREVESVIPKEWMVQHRNKRKTWKFLKYWKFRFKRRAFKGDLKKFMSCKILFETGLSSQETITVMLKCKRIDAAGHLSKSIRKLVLKNLWQQIWKKLTLCDNHLAMVEEVNGYALGSLVEEEGITKNSEKQSLSTLRSIIQEHMIVKDNNERKNDEAGQEQKCSYGTDQMNEDGNVAAVKSFQLQWSQIQCDLSLMVFESNTLKTATLFGREKYKLNGKWNLVNDVKTTESYARRLKVIFFYGSLPRPPEVNWVAVLVSVNLFQLELHQHWLCCYQVSILQSLCELKFKWAMLFCFGSLPRPPEVNGFAVLVSANIFQLELIL